jgi:hypothetical protein
MRAIVSVKLPNPIGDRTSGYDNRRHCQKSRKA